MRALKRALAVSALTAPLVLGCAALAAAQGGPDANFGSGQFAADQNGPGVVDLSSTASTEGPSHADFLAWANDNAASGGFAGAAAGLPTG